jgi:transcriptional regulator with XRE-family HTH domain
VTATASPDHSPEHSTEALHMGQRLKAFRQDRKLSLRDLGNRTGTTASFLSQLERGASGAAVSTLMKIAEALSISVADLFQDQPGAMHRVLRKGDRPALPGAEGYRKTLLSRQPIREFEVYVGFFEPGGSTGTEPYIHGDSHEMMFVLKGLVEIALAGESHRLSQGDCIEYRSSTPHRIVNSGPEPAEVQWIISPATSARAELDAFARTTTP